MTCDIYFTRNRMNSEFLGGFNAAAAEKSCLADAGKRAAESCNKGLPAAGKGGIGAACNAR